MFALATTDYIEIPSTEKNHEAFVAILAQEGFKSNGAGGIRERGLGDDKKGNIQRDMARQTVYCTVSAHSFNPELPLFCTMNNKTNTTNSQELRTNFVSQMMIGGRLCVFSAGAI